MVITAKSGNTPASVTKGISTVASDAGLIIADYAGEGSILTFADPNPDLKFFRPGDVVQETTGYTRDYVKYGSGSWSSGTWADVFNGDDESGAGWKASAASDPAVLNLTGRKVEGTTVTLRYGCKNNHSGVKINGRDVALVGNNTRQNIDVDVSAEGGFETFEIVPGGNDSGDTLSIFSLRVDSNVLLQGGTDVSVISTGYPDSNTMVVDGGDWNNSNQSQVWSNPSDWTVVNIESGFVEDAL